MQNMRRSQGGTSMSRMRKALLVTGLLASSAAGGLLAQGGGISHLSAAPGAPASYVAVDPARVLDTRAGGARRPEARTTIIVHTNRTGATAVGINIALTETEGPGFVTAWASDTAQPFTSIINSTEAGENISNFVIVPVAADGTFKLYTNSATHVVVDLMGYFVA